ncbi:hypothetical protein [Nocardia iowensis]|uniref:DUF5666 domain-containing protein n=1 Tax=Nocardia iowensis TaxID=204891 RepID=A0ABX8S1X3_NOCIO|nr:hypothetical protein [Nocardia iowensis]QXN94625.1 hypothetical protein KV110_17165 [Nocardia iowensis]
MLLGVAVGIVLALIVIRVFESASSSELTDHVPASASATQVNRGLATGKVLTNDGATLTVQGLLGAVSVVRTNSDTVVLVPGAKAVRNVSVGDFIVVHGDKQPDGSVTANLIVGG